MEGAETPCYPATAPKPERSGEGLYGGVGQNPCCSECKPGQELQETSDLCNCKQRFLYQILGSIFILYQILISCNNMEMNDLKIIQCDFLDFFLDSVSQLRCTYDENYRSPFFVSGENLKKIGSVSDTYLPHCVCVYIYSTQISIFLALISLVLRRTVRRSL